MALITITYIFSAGATIIASQHNGNNSVIANAINGNLDNTNISSTAGILYSQLSLGGNIVNSDIKSNAAIAYSKLNLSGSVKTTDLNFTVNSVPSGAIFMWSGSIATIPTGYVLCNGSNSTPDLRDRFVIAADADSGGTYNVGDTGNGSVPSTTINLGFTISSGGSGTPYIATDGVSNKSQATATFGTGSTNIAVYYALAYIMKT
jgi:hypothetical protein